MRVFVLAKELDIMMLEYLHSYCEKDSVVVIGKVTSYPILYSLCKLNVHFTDDNDFYLADYTVDDYSDGEIYTLNDVLDIYTVLFDKELRNYTLDIVNIATGERFSTLTLLKDSDKIEPHIIHTACGSTPISLLNPTDDNVFRLLNNVECNVETVFSLERSEVFFNLEEDLNVPPDKGFIESTFGEFKYSFKLHSDTFSCFDRRFLRASKCPVTSLKIYDRSLKSIKFVDEFPYNIYLNVNGVMLPTDDGIIEETLKDYIFNCINDGYIGRIYLSSANEDIFDYINTLSYPIEMIKIWR